MNKYSDKSVKWVKRWRNKYDDIERVQTYRNRKAILIRNIDTYDSLATKDNCTDEINCIDLAIKYILAYWALNMERVNWVKNHNDGWEETPMHSNMVARIIDTYNDAMDDYHDAIEIEAKRIR
jgi:hypothetical protein